MSYTWEITKIEKNPFDGRKLGDPKAFYSWELTQPPGQDWRLSSGFEYSDVRDLMNYFGVENPEELSGMTFESEYNDGSAALDRLLITIRNPRYAPPSDEEVRERVAKSLAQMAQPNLSGIDGTTICDAFTRVFYDADWLTHFKKRVSLWSDGKVKLVESDYEKFPIRFRGPADYLELVSDKKRQMIILGPYSTPVTFVEPK